MSPRERVLAAISRRVPDKVPKTASFSPALMEIFRKKTGSDSPQEHFGMEPRSVGWGKTKLTRDFSGYLGELPEGSKMSEYGVGEVPGEFHHFTKMVHPMRSLTTVKEVKEYPWPDIKADYRHADLEKWVAEIHDRGYFAMGGVGHIFEQAWYMTGMTKLLMGFSDNCEVAAAVVEHITEERCFMARRMAEAGVDMLVLGDDVGMQDRLMMSPSMWRKWLKPGLARVISCGRKVRSDIHVFYHSDGDIRSIIPDLIEVGVTVLNPVQPECMDPKELKRSYGDVLAFWGTIGTQSTMPFGTAQEVEVTVAEMITDVGQGGGLVLAPTHVLEPDVPWENVEAFFNAIEKHGHYQIFGGN